MIMRLALLWGLLTACNAPAPTDTSRITDASAVDDCWIAGNDRDNEAIGAAYGALDRMLAAERGVATVGCDAIHAYLNGDQVKLVLSGLGLDDDGAGDVLAELHGRMRSTTRINVLDLSFNRISGASLSALPQLRTNGVGYLNLAGNPLGRGIENILAEVSYANLRFLDVSQTSVSGSLDSALTEFLTGLVYLDIGNATIGNVVLQAKFPDLTYAGLARREQAAVDSNAIYIGAAAAETGVLPAVVHLDVRNRKLMRPDWLAAKLGRVGSVQARRVTNNLNRPLVVDASMVDVRGTALAVQPTAPDQMWRSSCAGAQKCATAGEMPLGGCVHYANLKALEVDVPAEHRADFAKSMADYAPYCAGV